MAETTSREAAEAEDSEAELDFEYTDGFTSRLSYWLRQESDHQWLSMGVFIGIVIVIALVIQQSSIMPGIETTKLVDSDNRVLDIAWNEDGSTALMVVSTAGGPVVQKWDDGGVSNLTFDQPRTVERITNGWLIGGESGQVGRCIDDCDSLSLMALDWQNSSISGYRIVDITSVDGVSGYLLINSYLYSSSDGNGTASDRGGTWSSSVRYFSNDVVSPAGFFPEDMSISQISASKSTVIACGNGWFGLSSASSNARGVIYSVNGDDTSIAPDLSLRHIGNGGYHSIILNADDSQITIIGLADVVSIDADDSLVTIDGTSGAPAAAIDGNGDIWLAGDFSSGQMEKIANGSYDAELVQINAINGLDVDVGTSRGSGVEFHGMANSGSSAVGYDYASASSLYSLDYFVKMVYVFAGFAVFAVMIWSIREKV
jgi:hypothetical protein